MKRSLGLAWALLFLALPARGQRTAIAPMLAGKDARARASIKAAEIAAVVRPHSFAAVVGGQAWSVRIHSIKDSGGGILTLVVSLRVNGEPVGLGAEWWTSETINISNPPIKVPDGTTREVTDSVTGAKHQVANFVENAQAAVEQSLLHTLRIIAKAGRPRKQGPGTTTSTFYPDAHPETTSVDGEVTRGGVDETFSVIRNGAGTVIDDTASTAVTGFLRAAATASQYATLERGIFVFDTSAIPDADSVSSVTLSLYGFNKSDGLGTPNLVVVSATTASNTALVASDFAIAGFGVTSYSSITYATFSITAYNNLGLNAAGLANISRTSVSKFGTMLSWDFDNSFTGVWGANLVSFFQVLAADTAGTTTDPKLVVEHSLLPSLGGGMILEPF